MSKSARLQLLGPFAVFGAVLFAEAAAFGLSQFPASQFLWRVNLEVFGIFQKSQYLLGPLCTLPFSQLVFIAVPVLGLALYGLLSRRELALAVASNFSLVYAAFLILAQASSRSLTSARVAGIGVPVSPNSYIPLILVGVSLLSAIVAHASYFRKICTETLRT